MPFGAFTGLSDPFPDSPSFSVVKRANLGISNQTIENCGHRSDWICVAMHELLKSSLQVPQALPRVQWRSRLHQNDPARAGESWLFARGATSQKPQRVRSEYIIAKDFRQAHQSLFDGANTFHDVSP